MTKITKNGLKNSPEGVNRLKMASFSLFFSDCSKWDFLGGWAFWDPHFWGHFWLFSQKTLASRGLHYYGILLLYIWVKFKHFPPLVDFSSLKSPSRHMWSVLEMWNLKDLYINMVFVSRTCRWVVSTVVLSKVSCTCKYSVQWTSKYRQIYRTEGSTFQ